MSAAGFLRDAAAAGPGWLTSRLAGLGAATVSAAGLTITIGAFTTRGYEGFAGGTVTLPAAGTWYVGVDLFTGALISLPRLGHRGWIPVAKVVCTDSAVTSLQQLPPVMPISRIPRTMAKLIAGQSINVVVMGSSLAEGGGTTDWSGMLFNQSSSAGAYRLPGTISFTNVGLGGTPNQYQLAQLGFGGQFAAIDYTNSGWLMGMSNTKLPPHGRTTLLSGVDLVVITLLANGGDYRMSCIEPIVRKLRASGVEVVLTTDNPQGPAATYAAMASAALYVDAPEVFRVADYYGVEVADTAAYVFDAYLRYPAVSIYRDTIHMAYSSPAGRTAQPGGGYEVWARAVRSLFNVDANSIGTVTSAYDFSAGLPAAWTGYTQSQLTPIAVASGALAVTHIPSGLAWGAWVDIPALRSGNTVQVTFDLAYPGATTGVEVGLQGGGGGWGSTGNAVFSTAGTGKTVTLTASRDILTGGKVLFYVANSTGDFTLDNVSITVTSTYEGPAFDTQPNRQYETRAMPPCRVVSDIKTPGDAFVTLPKNEQHLYSASNAGTLGASPLGSGSFARRFSSVIGASEDLLTLVTGQRASIAAFGAVAFSLVYYSVNGDAQITFDVYKNNAFQKTVTIAASTITREIYLPIYTPTEQGNASLMPDSTTIDIRVTSGTLRVAALVALTFDLDFVPPEQIKFIGTWTGRVLGGPPSMTGYATDTANDYAFLACPPTGRRVAFVCTAKAVTKNIDTWSGRTQNLNQSAVGTNHVFPQGNHIGPGDLHYIRIVSTLAGGGNSTTGYGLHIGGAIIVNDR